MTLALGGRSDSSSSSGPPLPTLARATFRHLLSAGSLSPVNPLRVVAHCDVDAAYAQMEGARLGLDSHAVPLCVQQWNGLIAIGYKAREFGISRHETVAEARRKCPGLVLVHVATYAAGSTSAEYHPDPSPTTHKVSLDLYRRESLKILAIFKRCCPLGAVEKASIDESYFDLTVEVRKLMLELYPYLATPPPEAEGGLDAFLPDAVPAPEWSALQGELAPRDETLPWTWTDVALNCGATIMARVRAAVVEELGYTTSAGIASNKTIAKLCSSMHKPNKQTTMVPSGVPLFLQDLPFQKIRFLGGKLGDAVASEWESSSVGGLWGVSREEMRAKFGEESSEWVFNVLRGIDHSPVLDRVATKTMLASKSVRPPIRTTAEADHWLGILAVELAGRLATAREERPGLWPKTLTLRYIVAGETPRSRQAAFPFAQRDVSIECLHAARRLWAEALGERASFTVVTVALGFSGLEATQGGQKGIAAFLAAPGAASAAASTSASASRKEITPPAAPKPPKQPRRDGIAAMFQRSGSAAASSSALKPPSPLAPAAAAAARASGSPDAPKDPDTWQCSECGERLFFKDDLAAVPLPPPPRVEAPPKARATPAPPKEEEDDEGDFFVSDNDDDAPAPATDDAASAAARAERDAEARRRFDARKVDHSDWHFALALSAADAPLTAGGSSSSGSSATAKRKAEPEREKRKKPQKGGIRSFFK